MSACRKSQKAAKSYDSMFTVLHALLCVISSHEHVGFLLVGGYAPEHN